MRARDGAEGSLLEWKCCRKLHRREIPRLRVPALRAKAKARDTPLGMTRCERARRRICGVNYCCGAGCPLRMRWEFRRTIERYLESRSRNFLTRYHAAKLMGKMRIIAAVPVIRGTNSTSEPGNRRMLARMNGTG